MNNAVLALFLISFCSTACGTDTAREHCHPVLDNRSTPLVSDGDASVQRIAARCVAALLPDQKLVGDCGDTANGESCGVLQVNDFTAVSDLTAEVRAHIYVSTAPIVGAGAPLGAAAGTVDYESRDAMHVKLGSIDAYCTIPPARFVTQAPAQICEITD